MAAPGMCNPDDENPCVDGDASVEAVTSDGRSTGQRNHDALKALCRAMLASGQLGSHKGLPVTMVISTMLAESESGKGHAVTGGGSLLPTSGGDRQAAAAYHDLSVFDYHTAEPLHLGRSRRLVSEPNEPRCMPAPRLTFPGLYGGWLSQRGPPRSTPGRRRTNRDRRPDPGLRQRHPPVSPPNGWRT